MPKADEALSALRAADDVRAAAVPPQREEVRNAERVAVILLAEHVAPDAEDAHVAHMQRVVIEVGDAAAVQHGF